MAEFVPTPQQQSCAILLSDPGCNMTLTEVATEVGVVRKTLYNWLQDEKFTSYVNKLIDRATDAKLSYAWGCLIKRMEKDTNAIRLFFELKEKYRQRIDINGNNTMTVKFEGIPRPEKPDVSE